MATSPILPSLAQRFGLERISLETATAEQRARLSRQLREGELVITPGRKRPLYFDGRFLTAADLSADQTYIASRLADFGRAAGFGVIEGLEVMLAERNARSGITIAPGRGVARDGQLVLLEGGNDGSADAFVAFDDLDEQAAVNVKLGLRTDSAQSRRLRSGLYVLALRPVEFSTNPTPSYPTTLDGQRSVHDGDIQEAVAITLVPFPERANPNASLEQRRGELARQVFFERSLDGALRDALPLAMLLFESGVARWLDMHLVRREVGTESGLAVSLNPRPRAMLEAWFHQYRTHLVSLKPAPGFAAADVWGALPPVGPVPANAVLWEGGFQEGLRQTFFPPAADVEFSFIPDDELPALIEEGLALPPIDLRAGEDADDHLGLVILAPVSRADLVELRRNLSTARLAVRPSAPGLLARRTPLASLVDLRGLARPGVVATALPAIGLRAATALPPLVPVETVNTVWQRAFSTAQRAAPDGMFWYMRRRQLPYSSEVSGTTLRLAGAADAIEKETRDRLTADARAASFDEATKSSPLLTRAELTNLLASPRLVLGTQLATRLEVSDLLRRAAVSEIAAIAAKTPGKSIGHDDAVRLAQRFAKPALGDGLRRTFAAAPELASPALADVVAASGVSVELDEVAGALADDALAPLAARITELARGNKPTQIAKLVQRG